MGQAFKCDVCEAYTDGEARATMVGWSGCTKLELCLECSKVCFEVLKSRKPKDEAEA